MPYPLGYPISALHSFQTKLDEACGGRPPVPGMAALGESMILTPPKDHDCLHNNYRHQQAYQDETNANTVKPGHSPVEEANTQATSPCHKLGMWLASALRWRSDTSIMLHRPTRYVTKTCQRCTTRVGWLRAYICTKVFAEKVSDRYHNAERDEPRMKLIDAAPNTQASQFQYPA